MVLSHDVAVIFGLAAALFVVRAISILAPVLRAAKPILMGLCATNEEGREWTHSRWFVMYHAYLMTDASGGATVLSEDFKIPGSEIPGWLIHFTPEVVAEWSRVLARSASTWRLH